MKKTCDTCGRTTKEYAMKKWREKMRKKYGANYLAHFKEIGARGGRKAHVDKSVVEREGLC